MIFDRPGGRGGLIQIEVDGRTGVLDFEMLLGDSAMVIFSDGCKWSNPLVGNLTRQELMQVVQEYCNQTRFQIDIQFQDGIQVLHPK